MKVSFARPLTPGAPAPQPADPTLAKKPGCVVDVEVVPDPTGRPMETSNTAAPAAAPAAVPIRATSMVVAPRSNQSPAGAGLDVAGDAPIAMEDIIMPRLSIVQRVGDLSTLFKPEALVLNRDYELARPAELVGLGFLPDKFVEKVEGGTGGETYDSEAEVHAAGGTLDYNEARATGKPLFQTYAQAIVLIKQPVPGQDDPRFALAFGGTRYALARWGMKGAAYTEGAKVLRTARSRIGWLSSGYVHGTWTLNTKVKKYPTGNVAVVPVLTAGSFTTPEFQAWASGLFN